MANNMFGSICLSDIPQDAIRTANNGKKYLSIIINERKQVDKYGNSHYIKAYVKKENEKQGVNYFIGDAKVSKFANQEQPAFTQQMPATGVDFAAPAQDDGLPF